MSILSSLNADSFDRQERGAISVFNQCDGTTRIKRKCDDFLFSENFVTSLFGG